MVLCGWVVNDVQIGLWRSINTCLMEYKGVKYLNKKKKIRAGAINDYESLRSTVQKSFPKDLRQEFIIYYFDEGEPYDVQCQDDYEIMVENPRPITLYVRNEGEQPLTIHSNEVSIHSGHPSSILNESIKEQSQQLLDAIEEKWEKKEDKKPWLVQNIKEQTKLQSSQPQIVNMSRKKEGNNNEPKLQKRQITVEPTKNWTAINEIEQEESSSSITVSFPAKQPQPKPEVYKKKDVDLSVVHKGVKCQVCLAIDIKGSKWKCLDIPEYDLCDDCYLQQKYKSTKEHKNKNYRFIEIRDLNFQKRINYSHTIRKLFDPRYKVSANDQLIGQWITEEDITDCNPNFVKELWNCSAAIARKTLSKFDDWETSYESTAAKQ